MSLFTVLSRPIQVLTQQDDDVEPMIDSDEAGVQGQLSVDIYKDKPVTKKLLNKNSK